MRAYIETARKNRRYLWYLDNNTKIKSGLEPVVAKPYYPLWSTVWQIPLKCFSNVLAVLAATLEKSFTSSLSR